MYSKLLHVWFQSEEYKKRKYPRIYPGDKELFAMIDFCSWLDKNAAEHSVQADGSKREPIIITDFPMRNAYPAGHKPKRRR